MTIGVGCLPLSYYLTPGECDEGAIKYVVDGGIAEPNDFRGWFGIPNLATTIKLDKAVDETNAITQQILTHEMEKDNLQHSIHSKAQKANVKVAKQREALLFGPKGIIPITLSILGASTLSGYAMLMRRKPGDVAKEEYEKLVSKYVGKEGEMLELVRGIEKFKKILPVSHKKKMKSIFNDAQNKQTTQVTVAKLRTLL